MAVTILIQVPGVTTVQIATDGDPAPDQLNDLTKRAIEALGAGMLAHSTVASGRALER